MNRIKLTVPLISQSPELPTGCEITAVTMMLRCAGNDVGKVQLAKEMPYDQSDCNKGFVGNPFTDDGNSIYPPALMALVTRYVGDAVNLSGQSVDQLIAHLAKTNHPIVVWVGNFDGFNTHALVMTGFDEKAVYYNDCWTGKRAALSIPEFETIRVNKQKLALSY
ncbi:C39 family peptidase [Lentilactobacillus kisonensis]|uniref:Peptidase C39-like domain-containing protein n=1 Tax=Lentilactobacillus kisonensis DSM 19906 = JCM 15041 TaxID=1423766 RepID=A0A0R1NRF7_9LACO|nr:C39 family peptidase [Lentilactobacillus kisonensis]KRL22942.1 hypothetical protein FC98_GL001697 [Lentilactobacillus kisonensis DSM 19906 = JCM 15041]